MKITVTDADVREAIANHVAATFDTTPAAIKIERITKRKGNLVEADVTLNMKVNRGVRAVEDDG